MITRYIFLLTVFAAVSFGQTPTPTVPPQPPAPVAKPTPADKSELTEAEFEAKILQSLKNPISWKRYSLPDLEINFEMPREPIRQTETFYDEALGRAKLELHLSLGEGSTFVVGHMKLPYAITDRALIREMFLEMAKEAGSGTTVDPKNVEDYDFQGHPAMRFSPPVPRSGFLGPRIQGLVVGRSLYLLYSMPHHSPAEDEPLSTAQLADYQKENERFFASVVVKKTATAATAPAPVLPVFASSLTGDTFRSDYFKFSFKLPKGWLQISQADVEGIRQVGRDYLAAHSDLAAPVPKTRQNLASFLSKPLGSERLAMIAVNVGPKTTVAGEALKLAEITEGVISKLPTYEVRKRASPTTLAGARAYTMETTIRMTDAPQHQVMFFLHRRDHLLVILVTYYDEADRKAAMAALESISFEAL